MNTVLKATGGELLRPGGDGRFSGVSIDSRTLRAGQMFICIRGDRFDGHDFLAEAARKGAAGLLLSNTDYLPQPEPGAGTFAVRVPDTLKGLQDLARYHRRACGVQVVAVTGTNGKSTTKEMIAAVTATRYPTLKSRGNLNNHIGLPLNLLDLEPGHKVAVLEMGMSDQGEIARLAEIAEPDIGLITNISEAHMVHLKTLRDVQAAKGELFAALQKTGTALVNVDDPLVRELARSIRARVITFGMDQPADVRGVDVRQAGLGFDFTLEMAGRRVPVRLPFPGRCNVINAVAAAAAGQALEIEPQEIAHALEQSRLLAQRSEAITFGGMLLINDTYNANPRSMQEAIQTLADLNTGGRRFLVAGDMLELGKQEQAAHRQLGHMTVDAGIDYLITVGPLARLAQQAALALGMSPDQARAFESHKEAAAFLKQTAQANDCLLFKGSRGARMERVLQEFTRAP